MGITISIENNLESLRGPWEGLAERFNSCLFSTFDYSALAWKHFSGPRERLCILTARDGEELVGIVPLRISSRRLYGIPARSLEFVAAWDGDRPAIIAANEPEVWRRVHHFLTQEFTAWDILDVMEQPKETIAGPLAPFSADKRFFCQSYRDSESYYISLSGLWEQYIERLDGKVRRNWRSRLKKLEDLPEGIAVESIEGKAGVSDAINRFVSLERKGWKAAAGIGIGKDSVHIAFYKDLCGTLSEKGQAAVHILSSGGRDLAAMLTFRYRSTLYEREITYDPAFAHFSPGIVLRALILKSVWGGPCREFDLMGMDPREGRPQHKIDWATGRRDTTRLLVFRKGARLLPVILGKQIKARYFAKAPVSGNAGEYTVRKK